ncbi:autocrine motility factor Isoform 2 [Colletotrichum incanum]|nr:autocrine motility factor Isoform 2 [Colletotrichum incanum]
MNILKTVMRKQEMASNPAADDTCCAICYEKVGEVKEEGDREVWRYLPCGHRFGGDCIQHWLGVASVDEPHCPWCRVSMRCDCGHPVVPTTKPTRNYMYWGWMPCEICHTQLQRSRKASKYFRGQLLPRLNSLIHSLDHNMASIPAEVPKEQEETPTKEPWEDREVWRKKWTEHFLQEDRKASASKSSKK